MSRGRSSLRREDAPLLRGEASYVADIDVPGSLHAMVVRSPYAHARILSVDASVARDHPGVAYVLTADELGEMPPIPVRVHPLPELEPFLQHPLARDKVRYVGDPVAVVVACDRYVAEDAAELVAVDYEPLAAVVSPEDAVAASAPLLFEAAGTNVAATISEELGDTDAAFAAAEVVVSDRFSLNRHTGVPLETRGLVAEYDASAGRLTVWGPTKVVHANRSVIAPMLGLPEERVRFVEPAVGGGFGIRGEIYPEDVLVPLLAMRLERPVKWIEDRREHMIASNHSREQVHDAELAVDGDGRILGLRTRAVTVLGGYLRTHGIRVPEISVHTFPGPYRVPNYSCEMACVVSNKTPSGTYRAPGRFEINFVRERLLDMAARELDLDEAEIRRRNLVTPSEIPYRPGTRDLGQPIVFESGDFAAVLHRALAAARYDEVRREQRSGTRDGRRVGVGVCCFLEDGGLGGLGGTPGEFARVVVTPEGSVTVFSGVAALGQGMDTVLAGVCADELGIDPAAVAVVRGDTDEVSWGGGTWASRGAILACGACVQASGAVMDRLRVVASRMLGVASEDLEVAGGRVRQRGGGPRSLSYAEVAQEVGAGGIDESTIFTAPRMTYSPGAQVAVVDVDEETGVISVRRHVVAYDVGRALNRTIVEGQMSGGAAQGLGGALLEELVYDPSGQPLATTFMDYLLPGSMDMPAEQEVLALDMTPSPLSPLGVKGVGEVGPPGGGAAIGNAVADALRGCGGRVNRLPLTPHRVLEMASAPQR